MPKSTTVGATTKGKKLLEDAKTRLKLTFDQMVERININTDDEEPSDPAKMAQIKRFFKGERIHKVDAEEICNLLQLELSQVVDQSEEPNQIEKHIPKQTFKNIVDDKTREFVGREYIYDQIDEYLNDKSFPSGYIILKGEPGIGKTALIANLVRQRGWIHHFVTEGTDSTEIFLASICSQLIVKYELPYSKLPEYQPEQRILTGNFMIASAT